MNVQLPVRQAILDRRTYEPPGEGRANKVRLDFNENTAGCSPAVKRALAKLSHSTSASNPTNSSSQMAATMPSAYFLMPSWTPAAAS
jgi:histidinol-phosphate/aromatic aminotransferase/cobyric acid decarboxylase-like protein